jgi:hypothetical protein
VNFERRREKPSVMLLTGAGRRTAASGVAAGGAADHWAWQHQFPGSVRPSDRIRSRQ